MDPSVMTSFMTVIQNQNQEINTGVVMLPQLKTLFSLGTTEVKQ